jgi:hypothetical protein
MDELLGFAPASYRPMERLLREDDFAFLAQQAGLHGWDAGFEWKGWRVFRMYLGNLRRDFARASRRPAVC